MFYRFFTWCLPWEWRFISNSIFKIALIGKTYELLLSLGSRSSSLFRLLRKSPKVSESTFFDICLSKNQSSYCNTHLKDIAHIAYLAYFNRLGQFTVQDVVKMDDYWLHIVHHNLVRFPNWHKWFGAAGKTYLNIFIDLSIFGQNLNHDFRLGF